MLPTVGSSSISSSGFPARAKAKLKRRFCPPDNFSALVFKSSLVSAVNETSSFMDNGFGCVMLQEVSVMPGLKVDEILELFRSYYPNPLSMKELVSLTALTKEASLVSAVNETSSFMDNGFG